MRNPPAAVSFSSSALLLQCLLLLIATAVVDAKLARNIAKEDLTETSLRIIGGAGVEDDNKYPWMAMSAGSLPRCGLAVISKRWLLTASHCVLNAAETGFVSASSSQKIHYGCAVQGSSSCKTTSVVQIEAHPCFDPCCDVHDIALIKTKDDMNVPFAPLNGITDYIPNEILMDGSITMMGWGSTCGSGRCVPHVLQTLAVNVVSDKECRDKNPSRVGRNSGYCGHANKCGSLFDDGDVFCAGGHKGFDSCNGDSGSPVVMRDPRSGKDVVVGLVILGSEVPLHNGACGAEGRVSVFTRLLQYAQYINTTTHDRDLKGCWGDPLPLPGTRPNPPTGPSAPDDAKEDDAHEDSSNGGTQNPPPTTPAPNPNDNGSDVVVAAGVASPLAPITFASAVCTALALVAALPPRQ